MAEFVVATAILGYLPTLVNTSADLGQQIGRPGSADVPTKVGRWPIRWDCCCLEHLPRCLSSISMTVFLLVSFVIRPTFCTFAPPIET
jgi:hypothetical protein